MKELRTILVMLLILLNIQSCDAQKNSEAKALNDKAMSLILENDSNIWEALNLLEQATSIDSSFYLAYVNKANLYCKIGKYNDAINTLGKAITIKKDYVEAIMARGFFSEKIGNKEDAKNDYILSLKIYNKLIKKSPNNLQLKINRAYTFMFIEGKEKGIIEYNRLRNKHPQDSLIKQMYDVFYEFNRKTHIDNICN